MKRIEVLRADYYDSIHNNNLSVYELKASKPEVWKTYIEISYAIPRDEKRIKGKEIAEMIRESYLMMKGYPEYIALLLYYQWTYGVDIKKEFEEKYNEKIFVHEFICGSYSMRE